MVLIFTLYLELVNKITSIMLVIFAILAGKEQLMANFNNVPTGDNSASNGGYTPESFSDTDDTAQLPKLDENVDSHNNNDNPDTQPTADPEQNTADGNNTERKSHLGRNVVMSGVAVIALAACIGIFNGGGDIGGSTPDTDNTPAATKGYTVNDIIDEPEEPIDDNIGIRSDNPENGLLASQVINDYMTVNSGVDTMMASEHIENWLYDNGYDTPSVGPSNDGGYILGGYGMITVRANDKNVGGAIINFRMINEDSFEIEISKTSLDDEATYNFTSNTLPTSEEANDIALEHLNW